MKTVNRDRLAKRIKKLRSENAEIKNQADHWRRTAVTSQATLGLVKKDAADKGARLAYINKLTIGPWLEPGFVENRTC